MKNKSFEHFCLTHVALGDCCGCAERVIDWRDIEMAAEQQRIARQIQPTKTKLMVGVRKLFGLSAIYG